MDARSGHRIARPTVRRTPLAGIAFLTTMGLAAAAAVAIAVAIGVTLVPALMAFARKRGGRAEKTVTLRCRLRGRGNIYLLP